jgi:hypothetical protein
VPAWYLLIKAAKYLGVPAWELLDRPVTWQQYALEAEAAENRAQTKAQERANRKNK